ncbi:MULTISPECIES: glycosyl transferase family 90 [Vibrio harveyi group]|uniref:Glycosyl transferase family 90 n=1 Tax=Vibrio jasicida TaxID=766224 RepID=A0ABW7J8G6_9VIBR|nr:glycosyl transferase family 90 [Vibrio jasicida]NOJ20477.1 glycosyltransferase [Vibrio jasicida]
MSFRKFKYYFTNSLQVLLPNNLRRTLASKLIQSTQLNSYIQDRVNYYNKVNTPFELSENDSTSVIDFRKTGGTTYYFDLHKVIKSFPSHYFFQFLNGDIRRIPEQPSFLKSRPINEENQNSVLLKLNEIRHFQFISDSKPFRSKKNMISWRGVGYQPHRKKVIEQYYAHPSCNIGQTQPTKGEPWEKEFMSIEEQLQYKFLLAIEGNDVATNLKWAMSSNSLVIMSKPKYETWFMEGRLEAGIHYVEVADDYSDLIEKMEYYIAHPEEAESIIKNAHAWVDQFRDQKRERLISLLVAKKYFEKSGQM